MSVIDPAVRRHESVAKHRGQPVMLLIAVTALVCIAISAALIGAGFSIMLDDLRHGVIDSVFDERRSLMQRGGIATQLLIGMPILLLLPCIPAYTWAATRYRGGEHPWPLPGAIAAVGVLVSFTYISLKWLPPLQVGTRADPEFHRDTPWGWGSWMTYRMNVWMPLVLFIVAAGVIVAAVQTTRKRARDSVERERLLAAGVRVSGDVVEARVHFSTDDSGSRRVSGVTATISYRDQIGQQRWVERFTRENSVQRGADGVQVLFDPYRPDDDRLIFVSFHREPLPRDWIGSKAR